MAERKKKDIEAVAAEGTTSEAVETKASKGAKSVTVTWAGVSREYSEEVHGEDFRDLAEAFAAKFNGTIK